MIEVDYHGIDLSVSDFPNDLRGWVAYSIAFAANTHCGNKSAALKLLLMEADDIIAQVKTGKAPSQ